MNTAPEQTSPERRFGAYAHAMIGKGEGPTYFRSIGESWERIQELCTKKGIPVTDPRYYTLHYLADSRYTPVMHDEKMEDPNTVARLKEIRAHLLGEELVLRGEPDFSAKELESKVLDRVDERRELVKKEFEHLLQIWKEMQSAA